MSNYVFVEFTETYLNCFFFFCVFQYFVFFGSIKNVQNFKDTKLAYAVEFNYAFIAKGLVDKRKKPLPDLKIPN